MWGNLYNSLQRFQRRSDKFLQIPGGVMRLFWLDNLKGIGIFLVMFGHTIPDSHLKQYIYSFHVPLFFFISGLLFDPRKYDLRKFAWRKFDTLLFPYLFFAALSFLFWQYVVRTLSIGGKALAVEPLIPLVGIFYSVGSGEWRVPMNITLWFLPCLFLVEMMFFLVKSRYALPVFAILGYLATFVPFRLPWSSDVALVAIVFYGIGNFFRGRRINYKALPLLLVLHLAFCFLNSPVDMNNRIYGNMIYFYIAGCSGTLFYSEICRFIGRSRILEYVGKNTLILIGTVGITWFILNGIFYLLFETKIEQTGLGFALAASILQIGLTIPVIYVINRWMPILVGRQNAQTAIWTNRNGIGGGVT